MRTLPAGGYVVARWVLALATLLILLIASIAAAEPQPVDGGWQQSDEVPQETPTAPPPEVIPAPTATPQETATEPEEAEAGWRGYGLILCFAMIMISLWYCRMGAKR